jgi:hypothetical protein
MRTSTGLCVFFLKGVLFHGINTDQQEDSIMLWQAIVSSPLLKDTSLILFLNKCDILKVGSISLRVAWTELCTGKIGCGAEVQ